MQQNIVPFLLTKNQEKLLMKKILIMYLNQFTVQFYQTYTNHLEKAWVGLFIYFQIILLIL